MSSFLSRRNALQAAGATVLAAGLTNLTAGSARADGTADAPAPQLVTYPIPAGVATQTSFKVRVRTAPDGEWQTLTCYAPGAKEINPTTGAGKVWGSSMVYFDFRGPVELEVTYLKGGTTKARVRPDSYGITPEVGGDTVVFTLDEPKDVVVQINDEIFDCLHVITNSLERHAPSADDPEVLYYGPGLHTVPGNVLTVTSGQTVYLAGGAVLKAEIDVKGVENVTVKGHGVLLAPTSTVGGVHIEHSQNCRVENIIFLANGIALGEAENVHVKKARVFTWGQWGDGLTMYCSKNVTFDGVFVRSADDSISIYAHRDAFYGDKDDWKTMIFEQAISAERNAFRGLAG